MKRRAFLRAAGLAGAGVASYGVFVEPRTLAITEHVVHLSRRGAHGTDTTPTGRGAPIVVAQLSDLHLKRVGAFHEGLARRVDQAEPDLLLFTGDTVDERENLPLVGEFLGLLGSAAPRIAVMGNWEYWGGVSSDDLGRAFRAAGGDVLVNRSAVVSVRGRELLLTGVDDWAAGRPDLARALRGAPEAPREVGHHVILSHCPVYRDVAWPAAAGGAAEGGAGGRPGDLVPWMLSGHTHGGQIDVFGLRFLPHGSGRYVEGWYAERPPHLYVSRGIGTSVVPARLGSRPEVAIFHVHLDPP